MKSFSVFTCACTAGSWAGRVCKVPNAGNVRLRVAQTGQLDVPDTYLAYQYESVATVLIDGTEVTLSQNPGRNAMASWTRNGFDYLLLCEEPQMNLLGGVIQDFVTQTTASTVSGQRVTQE